MNIDPSPQTIHQGFTVDGGSVYRTHAILATVLTGRHQKAESTEHAYCGRCASDLMRNEIFYQEKELT